MGLATGAQTPARAGSVTGRDWTPAELAAEAERRAELEAAGTCPDSGDTIAECWGSGLCDCAWIAPVRCGACGVHVWNIGRHRPVCRRRPEAPGSMPASGSPERPDPLARIDNI